MPRLKKEAVETDRYAVMTGYRMKKVVRAWQYYSVFDFCRWFGKDREESDRIAKWCRDKAVAGDSVEEDGFSIRIEERVVLP